MPNHTPPNYVPPNPTFNGDKVPGYERVNLAQVAEENIAEAAEREQSVKRGWLQLTNLDGTLLRIRPAMVGAISDEDSRTPSLYTSCGFLFTVKESAQEVADLIAEAEAL